MQKGAQDGNKEFVFEPITQDEVDNESSLFYSSPESFGDNNEHKEKLSEIEESYDFDDESAINGNQTMQKRVAGRTNSNSVQPVSIFNRQFQSQLKSATLKQNQSPNHQNSLNEPKDEKGN